MERKGSWEEGREKKARARGSRQGGGGVDEVGGEMNSGVRVCVRGGCLGME